MTLRGIHTFEVTALRRLDAPADRPGEAGLRLLAAGDQDVSAYLDRIVPWHREAAVEEVGILAALLRGRAPQILAARGAHDG